MNETLDIKQDRPRKGRGAVSNQTGRYEREERVAIHDGWNDGWEETDEAPPPQQPTQVQPDKSRKVIARNVSPDVPFDRSINPYRGCEHGCVYCFARPTHAWLGLSPGLDFETKLFAKHDAAAILRRELSRPAYKPAVLALGANTDPYQPIERDLKITRQVLEVLAEARHPITIVTKSHLVTRDIDILAPMARDGLVKVMLSVTTLDRGLARLMEPRAPTPEKRIAAIGRLASAGIPAGVLAAPMIPAINDAELEAILERVAAVGGETAGYVLLRLPLEIKQLFEEWLEAHFPDRKSKVLKLIRETRGGKLYDPKFGQRQRGSGPYATLLRQRFQLACKRLGLNQEREDQATDLFRRPRENPDQLTLF